MYHHATSNPLSRLRFFVVCAVLLLGAVKAGYGQRVYADAQQSTQKISVEVLFLEVVVSEVVNQPNAINPDTTEFSTLKVNLEVAGLFSARQNLQFLNQKPSHNSPVIIKIGSSSSLLDLLGGFAVQRTNGGLTSPVPQSYSGNQLLNLLNLFGGSTIGTLVIPANGQTYDGVRFEINSLLGVGIEAYNFYAFYITPPEIQSIVTACENLPVDVTISNYEEAVEDQGYPYTYQLYTDQLSPSDPSIIETPIENVTFNDGILTLPATLPAGDYYLEARENDVHPSARTKITLVRNAVTGGVITGDQLLCANFTPAELSATIASTGADTLTYRWQSKTTGGYTDIPGATAPNYTPPTLSETTMYRRATTSTANGKMCEAFSNEITITVNPVPGISLHSQINVCQEDDIVDFPYNSVANAPTSYSIYWLGAAPAMGFQDINNKTHSFLASGGNIPISIPSNAAPGTYQGILTIRNLDGCASSGQAFIVNILPKPPIPDIDVM